MHKVALGAMAVAFSLVAAPAAHAQMKVTSAEMKDGGTIANEQVATVFNGSDCKGGNISPSLSWTGAPSGTKSFVITVYDPDAPTGSGFWHWAVFNIPASTMSIPKNAGDVKAKLMPKDALQLRNDYGLSGYGGPCPPKGDAPHHYIFTVIAADVDKLPILKGRDTSATLGRFNLHYHTLGTASLTATYGR